MDVILSIGFVIGLFALLIVAALIVLFFYRIAKRADEKSQETFEKRDN